MIVYTLSLNNQERHHDILTTAFVLYGIIYSLVPGMYKYYIIAALVLSDAALYTYKRYQIKDQKRAQRAQRRAERRARRSQSIQLYPNDNWYGLTAANDDSSPYASLDSPFYSSLSGANTMMGGATYMYQDRMNNGRFLPMQTRAGYDKAHRRDNLPGPYLPPSTARLPPDAKEPLLLDTRDRLKDLDPYDDTPSVVYDMSHNDTTSTMSVDYED